MGRSDEPSGNGAKPVADPAVPLEYGDLRPLGDGAEGGAWEAVHRPSGARVVLKRVAPSQRHAVEHAFSILRKAGSPHLPAPRGLVRAADGSRWLSTDFVEGEPLPRGPADVATAAAEARAVAHALAAIHDAGTHHGDVSAGNVVVTPTGGVTLVDLGQLGRLGTGTPGFIAPEVLGGGGGSPADAFALGCLLCWRLCGEPPWRRPEALASLRPRSVESRLSDLLPAGTPEPLRALIARLLHPDPHRRPRSLRTVVERLGQIESAARAGVALRSPTTWWMPARWPYRGVELAATLERLRGDTRPRLVVVAGPPHCGRGRVVEELILGLQAVGVDATLADPDGVATALQSSAPGWADAWVGTQQRRVVGVTEPLPFAGEGVRAAAALLRAAASLARSTVVTVVDAALGDALGEPGGPDVAVIALRSWSVAEVKAALDTVLESEEIGAWAQTLHAATGGWPARVVAAASASAAASLERPRAEDVEAALAEHAHVHDLGLDTALARRVLVRHWGGVAPQDAALPSHLLATDSPRAAAVVAARRVLGPAAEVLARRTADACTGPVPLTLAIDAKRYEAVDARAGASLSARESGMVVRWLDDGHADAVSASTRAWAAEVLLADGEAERALALLAAGERSDPGTLQAARAQQRLGRIDAALETLAAIGPGADVDTRWRAAGLRWRSLVDAGRPAEALQEAEAAEIPTAGPGPGLARLWAGYAALVQGRSGDGDRWLRSANAAVGDADGSAAAGVRARVSQLLGNIAQERGELDAATALYRQAAASFAAAGESVGGLLVRGNLSAVAIQTADIAGGLEHGRAALRGLVVRGQVPALAEAVLNLVQHLARIGAAQEAASVHELLADVIASQASVAAVTRARMLRIEAEVTSIGSGRAQRDPAVRRAAEARFVAAGRKLGEADAAREALDSWLRAASVARAGQRLGAARAHLARARALLQRADDLPSRLGTAIEALAIAAASGDAVAIDAAVAELRGLPRAADLRDAGRLELSWAYDRALFAAFKVRRGAHDPRRRVVARRLLSTLEMIMAKTPSLDRNAVRGSFAAENGDAGALRDLLDELDGAPPDGGPEPRAVAGRAEAAVPPSAAADADRLDRLLKMYRRLAREDHLEPLLSQVVDALMDLTDAERGAVVVRREGRGQLEVTRELAEGSDGFKFSRSVIERVLQTGEPVLSVDAAEDARFDGSRSISHLNLRSVLAVPLRFRGQLLGAAYVDHRLRRGNFDESDLAQMEEFAELAALAVAHTAALEAVTSQAAALRKQGKELADLLEAREAEVAGLREEVRSAAPKREGYRGIVGATAPMQKVFRLIDRLADSEVPVVVYGESGTGKELVARAIHDAGSRAKGPFVAENCGAIPETLLESVLFGHAKGAFTGAQKSKAGLFEAAGGGTIFLDEVSEMSAAMQTKLLRVLQEGEVRRVGENQPRPVDVRVIAASNRDLDDLVDKGEFRRDLYYRIHVVRVDLPALRERTEDISVLIEHFAARHAPGRGLDVTPAAMRSLCAYAWPGNVRELENEVQRWAALCEGAVAEADLSSAIVGQADDGIDPDDLRIRPRVDKMERALIARALERTGGNQTKAAELLGLSRYGLQKKLRRLSDADK